MTIAQVIEALREAENFIGGFEGDELQDGLPEKLLEQIALADQAAQGLQRAFRAAHDLLLELRAHDLDDAESMATMAAIEAALGIEPLPAESTAAPTPTVENKRGAWFARLDAAQVTFDGFQAGVTTDPDEHGRRYISEPWNETDGSLCDLADWHHTADDAREAASAASFCFGHSGIFDNLIDDE